METYRENATCPKCLGADVVTRWCKRCYNYTTYEGHGESKPEERMHRTCKRCWYFWDELPAPAPAEEPKP